jgi:lysophospholipase L1-like esterase
VNRARRSATALLAAGSVVAALLSGAPPTAQGEAGEGSTAKSVRATGPEVTLLGRWGRDRGVATTVNSGSRALLRFTGRQVTAVFDQQGITFPPQVYAWIDGERRRYTVDRDRIDLTPQPLPPGAHRLRLTVKDVDERGNRWTPPFASALRLVGFRLAPAGEALQRPRPSGPRIEFLGDSITQGVRALGPEVGVRGSDATKGYAWLTGQAFGGDFRQTGFGAQGITVPGGGGVPVAATSLGLNFAGSPVDRSWVPQAVVVNQGTNDVLGNSLDGFRRAYREYLLDIHRRWPQAWIFALRPFGGHAEDRIRAAVRQLDAPRIRYVDTTGWVRHLRNTDGLHPSVAGHAAAARRLAAVIERWTGWDAAPIRGASAGMLPAGASKGFEGDRSRWRTGENVESLVIARATTHAAYQGRNTLRAASAAAPVNRWRTIVLAEPVPLPRRARSVFAFVLLPGLDFLEPADARISVVRNGRTHRRTFTEVPSLAPFIPWIRVHVNLPRGGELTRIAVSVRESSGAEVGRVDFQVDAVGWTDRRNG